MKKYHVYRQFDPVQVRKGEWRADVRYVGDVYAEDGSDAVEQARRFAAAPMVQEAK